MKEKYQFDKTDFDYMILGTDLVESILGASLCNKSKSMINLEFESQYSGSLKSLNLRDFGIFIQQAHLNKDQVYHDKQTVLNSKYQSFEQMVEEVGFRGFNIDLEPKFLFSSSMSTTELINIGVDDYLQFKTLQKIYHKKEEQLLELPVSKQKIFSSPLSLTQKKYFIENLDKIQKFIQYNYKETLNMNSIKDYKKNIYTNPKTLDDFQKMSLRTKERADVLFDEFLTSSDSVFENITRYSIVSRIKPKNIDTCTVEEFLIKFHDFVDSMGVHSLYPYLYPFYGIADLSQVFTRIGAVYGGYFVLSMDFQFQSIEKEEDKFKITIKESENEYQFTAGHLIVGHDFKQTVCKQLHLD